MSHTDPHSDLNRAMRQEAREEREAEAEAQRLHDYEEEYLPTLSEAELHEEHSKILSERADKKAKARKLRSKIEQIESEIEDLSKHERAIERELERR